MSSTHPARCGKTSLTQRPDCPCRRNGKGDFITFPGALVAASTRSPPPGSKVWPCRFSSSGLWSNVSIWLTPPFMNNWMIRFTFGGPTIQGRPPVPSEAGASLPSKSSRARPPKPPPSPNRTSLRVRGGNIADAPKDQSTKRNSLLFRIKRASGAVPRFSR